MKRITNFQVEGIPASQGSMKIMPIRRVPPSGLTVYSVRELLSCVTMTSDNAKLKEWRKLCEAEATAAMEGEERYEKGPVKVSAIFSFPFLKSHFKSDGVTLRDDRPFYKETMPDTDKLQRALGDEMSKVVFKDDGQIAWWDVQRIYGSTPGVSAIVYAL